ncbi:MAG: hypothetical protein IIT66_00645 [Acetobacter sp.]|nr:hypothetical protein [Acetobacter sp.]
MATLSLSQYVKNSVSFMRGGKPITCSMSKEEADKERERQYMLAAEADSKDTELKKMLNDAVESIDGWTA